MKTRSLKQWVLLSIAGTTLIGAPLQAQLITTVTDSSGTIQARYDYDPYGRVAPITSTVPSDFQYAGMYEHATSGLNLTLFRAYDQNTGRWLSRDPLREDAGTNLYSYVGNNPLEWIDRLGLDIDSPAPGDAQILLEIEAQEQGITVEQLLAKKAAQKAAQEAAQKLADEAAKLSENQIKKTFNCTMDQFHREIKPTIQKQFKDLLDKTGKKNFDVGVDSNGNIVLKVGGKSIPTGVSAKSYSFD